MHLLIIIPTYNEAENIKPLLAEVTEQLTNISTGGQIGGILVVDDGSPDGTAAIAKDVANNTKQIDIVVLEREKKLGLANAYLTGFRWGIEHSYDTFLEMDADFSHKPIYIKELWQAVQTHEVAIGSRYVAGGGVEGWTFLRKLISQGGSLYSRIILNVPIHDLTGGFNMWRLSALEKIRLDSIISKGYAFQIEMKTRAYKSGCSILEVPIIFPDRIKGESKMSSGIFKEALFAVWKLRNIQ